MTVACVLMTDISGSTNLYETSGNAEALATISRMLDRMRAIVEAFGGVCVKSQGDDVLSYFDHPEKSFQAAWNLINEPWPRELSVHAGMYVGNFLTHENDIYGDTVNTAARLASMAKSGEVLLGDETYDMLSDATKSRLLPIGKLQLRGKAGVTRVYSGKVVDFDQQTVLAQSKDSNDRPRADSADFEFGGQTWRISDGDALTIGRSPDCDIVIAEAWVSRKHAQISLRHWQLEFADHSSSGSVLELSDGKLITVHRRATLLSGRGVIYAGSRADPDSTSAVSFVAHDLVSG